MFVDELARLGADIRTDGHHAVVRGRPRLSAAPVRATDIRAGAGTGPRRAGRRRGDDGERHRAHRPRLPGFDAQLRALGRRSSVSRTSTTTPAAETAASARVPRRRRRPSHRGPARCRPGSPGRRVLGRRPSPARPRSRSRRRDRDQQPVLVRPPGPGRRRDQRTPPVRPAEHHNAEGRSPRTRPAGRRVRDGGGPGRPARSGRGHGSSVPRSGLRACREDNAGSVPTVPRTSRARPRVPARSRRRGSSPSGSLPREPGLRPRRGAEVRG